MAQLLKTEFEGQKWPLFKLSVWTAVLTVLTLGFYRFWMKTRLRQHFWSSVRPNGTPLEYVGKGIEKFTGFLIALVFLALLIGILALVLVYASYALFQEEFEAYLVAGLIAIPLIYFAAYRAKRYVYARTRWRGIRFALEPAARKYAMVAVGHVLLTVISLGVLWPRMTFKLEKFRTDRTYFGDQRLHQGGSWFGLAKSFIPVWIGLMLSVGTPIAAAIFLESDSLDGAIFEAADDSMVAAVPFLIILGVLILSFFYTRYRVVATRYLANHKTAGEIGLVSHLSFPTVLGINFGGYFLTNICTGIATVLVTGAMSLILLVIYPGLEGFGFFASTAVTEGTVGEGDGLPSAGVIVFLSVFTYMSTFLFFTVFRQVFVLFPVWRHYASTLTITGAEHLDQITQRNRDEAGQAEGMAEAFDMGAAI